jgi:hypothetical protein
MSQSHANTWLHVRLPVLHQTLVERREVPARHLQALAPRLADLGATALEASASPPGASPSPWCTIALNDPSRAPKTPISHARVIAARTSGRRGKTCGEPTLKARFTFCVRPTKAVRTRNRLPR